MAEYDEPWDWLSFHPFDSNSIEPQLHPYYLMGEKNARHIFICPGIINDQGVGIPYRGK